MVFVENSGVGKACCIRGYDSRCFGGIFRVYDSGYDLFLFVYFLAKYIFILLVN